MKKVYFVFQVLARFFRRYSKRAAGPWGYSRPGLFLLRKRFLLPAVFLIAVFILAVRFAPLYLKEQSVSEGIIGVYNGNSLPGIVTNLISEPLVKIDKSGFPQPVLAAGWQVSDNSTIYTFKLRDNLYWNDGSRLKSSDIKLNLPDVEVAYPNDQTIVFKLPDSFSPFPALLTAPVFKNGTLTGTGRFKVSYLEQSRGVVTKLELNPQTTNSALPKVMIRFYPDEKIARTAFDLGEIESIIGVADVVEFKKMPAVEVKNFTLFNRVVGVFYNVKDSVLSDKNLRKALGCAIPRTEEERAKTSLPVFSWAYNDHVRDCVDDLETAEGFLSKVSSGKDSTITLTATPALARIGEKIVQAWKQGNINAVLRVESGLPQNFQALLISQPIPLDPDQYALWHSTQTNTNLSHYSSPRVDKDLEDGRKIGDVDKRKEKYLDFQKVLADDTPATFLYFPKTVVVYRKKAEVNLSKVLNLQLPQM